MPITLPGDPPPNPKHRWVLYAVLAAFFTMLAIPFIVTRFHDSVIEGNQNAVIDALGNYARMQNELFKTRGEFAATFQDLGDAEWSKMQDAAAEKPTQFRGYYFKTFAAQAQQAEGGAKRFRSDGGKVMGFALMAVPVKYGFTGRFTFFISSANDQKLYYHDLGVKTDTNVRLISEYFIPPGAKILGE